MKPACATAQIAFNKVLIATDLSPVSDSALRFAQSIARRYDSKLFVTNVVSPAQTAWVPPEYWVSSEQIEEAVWRRMHELNARLQDAPHETLIEHGGISETISAEIEELGIDLLVLGTHAREGFGRLMMGSIAEKLFRQVKCPVLTVGPRVTARAPGKAEFKEIIFTTNFGPESLGAAPYAISLAQEFQARLTLLNVVSERIDARIEPRLIALDRTNRLRALIPAEAELWCKPEFVVEFGKAGENILAVAQERRADLIVLGAKSVKGHTATATHLFPATAHTAVCGANCPVMTIRA